MVNVDETSSTNFKLRAFLNSKDDDFIKALKLYTKYISPTSLTDTNQIIYCLDNYSFKYPNSKFIISGFYQNKQLIGYCQFIYLSDERLIIIDYIVIDEAYRGITTFYAFIEKIKEFILVRGYEVSYLVGEINIQNFDGNYDPIDISSIPTKAKMLIKLLKSTNFGEIKSLYIQPMLGLDNLESEQRSILMLHPANQYATIKKETFLKIVHAIYFKHYERWYKLFFTESQATDYSSHLHKVYSIVSAKLQSKFVQIERDDYILDNNDFDIKTREGKPQKKALVVFGFLGLLLITISTSIILKKFFSLNLNDQAYLLGITATLYLFILSLFSERAAKFINKLLEKFIDKIT